MVKYFVGLFVLAALLSCEAEKQYTFIPEQYRHNTCDDCSLVSIDYTMAIGPDPFVKIINQAQETAIISLLHFNEETPAGSIPQAIKSFSDGYGKLKSQFPEAATPWEANIEGTLAFEDTERLSLVLDSYLYTGGAHGYGTKHFLNFDKKKQRLLEPHELTSDWEGLTVLAETLFRAKHGIEEEAPINSTGLMFEDDIFYLPEEMGFTPEGLLLYYAPYEIAPYADGAITLTIPWEAYGQLADNATDPPSS